jgi:hypothetical protein
MARSKESKSTVSAQKTRPKAEEETSIYKKILDELASQLVGTVTLHGEMVTTDWNRNSETNLSKNRAIDPAAVEKLKEAFENKLDRDSRIHHMSAIIKQSEVERLALQAGQHRFEALLRMNRVDPVWPVQVYTELSLPALDYLRQNVDNVHTPLTDGQRWIHVIKYSYLKIKLSF